MHMTIDKYDFRKAFLDIRPDNFSLMGMDALFSYLEEMEDSIGEPIELDVIGICCEFSEDTAENIAANYSIDLDGCEDQAAILDRVVDALNNEGVYVASGWMDDNCKELIVYRNY